MVVNAFVIAFITQHDHNNMFSNNSFFDAGAPTSQNRSRDWAHVTSNLYIGSGKSVSDTNFLSNHNIDLIINASNVDAYLTPANIPTVMVLDIRDEIPPLFRRAEAVKTLLKKVKSVTDVMHEYIQKDKNVLVHCHAGVNRSAMIIATYLITKRNYTSADAIAAITKANNTQRYITALSNPLFVEILSKMDKC